MIWRIQAYTFLLISQAYAQFFRAPNFDCSRIHPRFCCSTRVRLSCPQLCNQMPCQRTPTFVQPFSPHIPPTLPFKGLAPQPRLPSLIDPSTLTSNAGSQQLAPDPPPGIVLPPEGTPLAIGTPFPSQETSFRPPTDIKPVDGFAPSRKNHSSSLGTSVGGGGSFANNLGPPFSTIDFQESTPFPTLINFTPSSTTSVSPSVSSGSSSVGSTAVTRKKSLKPPSNENETLVELESIDRRAIHIKSHVIDEDIETARETKTFDGIEAEIAKTLVLGTTTFTPPIIANFSSQEPSSVEPTSRTTISERGPGSWSFKIMPSKKARDPTPSTDFSAFTNLATKEKTSAWIYNQTDNLPHQGNGIISGEKLNLVIDSIFTKQTIEAITNLTGKRPAKRPSSMTAAPPIVSNLSPTNQTTQLPGGKCGVAPAFTPCLDLASSNQRLLACCKARLMPEGCLSLCRYDTTQAEVKRAFDAGKCGILNVAPFLECASQGQDNRQCCQHRNISLKSGPQCEVFCHPRDGLGSLGLQHLTCQHVISELLQCHHSGLLP